MEVSPTSIKNHPFMSAVEQNWPMVLRIAGKIARKSRGYWSQEELASFGYDGLTDALRRFDPAKGCWIGYAALRIRGAILDGMGLKHWHMLPRGRARRVSVSIQSLPLEAEDELRAMLLPLKPSTRKILRLMYEQGLQGREVARLLRVSEASVSKRHKAALRLLRTQKIHAMET